jgi:outer membrane protein assembly factor BamE (lipoprotein component of BamABCDE complex)
MVTGLGLLFFCVLWMSPEARRGNHNERQARLVQLGMTAAQVHHLMGQP